MKLQLKIIFIILGFVFLNACSSYVQPVLQPSDIVTGHKMDLSIDNIIVEPTIIQSTGLIRSVRGIYNENPKKNIIMEYIARFPNVYGYAYKDWQVTLERLFRDFGIFKKNSNNVFSLRVSVLDMSFRIKEGRYGIDITAHYKLVNSSNLDIIFSKEINSHAPRGSYEIRGQIVRAVNNNIVRFIEELYKSTVDSIPQAQIERSYKSTVTPIPQAQIERSEKHADFTTINLLDHTYHMGDNNVSGFKNPKPQGIVFKSRFNITDTNLSTIFITIWVSDLVPKNHEQFLRGYYKTKLLINHSEIGILNNHISGIKDKPKIEKITIGINKHIIKKGYNEIKIIAGYRKDKNNKDKIYYDDFQIHKIIVRHIIFPKKTYKSSKLDLIE